MMPFWLGISYSALIVAASLAGGWFPSRVRLTHNRLQIVLSFVGGLMLGIALLHLLPHAVAQSKSTNVAFGSALAGLLVMFLLISIFHFNQHHFNDDESENEVELAGEAEHSGSAIRSGHATPSESVHVLDPDPADMGSQPQELSQASDSRARHQQPGQQQSHRKQKGGSSHGSHDHGNHSGHACDHGAAPSHRLSWIGVAIGLSLHTLIDGVALGAAILADQAHEGGLPLYGAGVFLAVMLHKPLDAMSITSLMAAGGWTRAAQQWINLGFAMMCPLGVMVVLWSQNLDSLSSGGWLGAALGFSAGVFLCISLGDLLPEVQFHQHDRWKLSTMLMMGVAVAYYLGFLEPKHQHRLPPPSLPAGPPSVELPAELPSDSTTDPPAEPPG